MLNILKKRRKKQKVKVDPTSFKPKQVHLKKTVKKLRKSTLKRPDFSKVIGILFVLITIICFYLGVNFLNSDRFRTGSFEFIGNKTVSSNELTENLSNFSNQSIFIINPHEIEEYLLEKFIYFKSIKTRKALPNKIIININEREPQIILINLNGAYLIDDEGKIIDVLLQKEINLDSETLKIIKNLGNPEADYVKERMTLSITPVADSLEIDEAAIDDAFSQIPLEQKIRVLEDIRQELLIKTQSIFDEQNASLEISEYATLPRIYAYENKTHNKFDEINTALMELSIEVSKYFAQHPSVQIVRILWEGNYQSSFYLTTDQKMVFGTRRDINEQIEDFEIITDQLNREGKTFEVINLTSKKISVK